MHEAETMSLSDNDLELLESYLDDELTGRELDSLRQRLSAEPALTSALDDLRSQRQMRQDFFAVCEPDEASVHRLMTSVNKSVTRDLVWSQRSRSLSWIGSLAACLLVGFTVGHGMQGTQSAQAPVPSGSQSVASIPAVGSTNVERVATNDSTSTPPIFDGPRVNNFVVNPFRITPSGTANVSTPDPFPGASIAVIDHSGNIMHRFDSHDQYLKFVNDQLTQPSTNPSLSMPGGH